MWWQTCLVGLRGNLMGRILIQNLSQFSMLDTIQWTQSIQEKTNLTPGYSKTDYDIVAFTTGQASNMWWQIPLMGHHLSHVWNSNTTLAQNVPCHCTHKIPGCTAETLTYHRKNLNTLATLFIFGLSTARQKNYTPQVQSNWGSNSWPSDHDSTFHVSESPALTTRPSVTSHLIHCIQIINDIWLTAIVWLWSLLTVNASADGDTVTNISMHKYTLIADTSQWRTSHIKRAYGITQTVECSAMCKLSYNH